MRHFFSDVAGENHRNEDGSDRQAIIPKCTVGELLVLEHEPDNPADINAIRVRRETGEQIGYLPRDLAGEVVSRSAKGWEYYAAVAGLGRAHGDGPYGVTLLIVVDASEVDRLTLSQYVARVLADRPSPPRRETPAAVERDLEFRERAYRAARSVETFEEDEFARWAMGVLIVTAIVVAILVVLMTR